MRRHNSTYFGVISMHFLKAQNGAFLEVANSCTFLGVGGGGWAGLGGGIPDVFFFFFGGGGGINSTRWVNPTVRSKGN